MDAGSDESCTEMHRDVSWMVPADRPILQFLADVSGAWQKPATIDLNVSYSRYHIADRLRILNDHGLVERHSEDTPAYRITESGREFLRGNLDADDLED